jgi:acyl-coenzyme A thioesterase PaaI-like protein
MQSDAIQDMWPEYFSYCWGCGRNNEHGLRIKSYWQGDEAVCTWQAEPYYQAFPGFLNGGIIATIIDCHCINVANAVAYQGQEKEVGSELQAGYVTGSLSIKYLRPTPIDRPVLLRAKVKQILERKIIVSCSLFSDGIECARGETVAVKIGP